MLTQLTHWLIMNPDPTYVPSNEEFLKLCNRYVELRKEAAVASPAGLASLAIEAIGLVTFILGYIFYIEYQEAAKFSLYLWDYFIAKAYIQNARANYLEDILKKS